MSQLHLLRPEKWENWNHGYLEKRHYFCFLPHCPTQKCHIVTLMSRGPFHRLAHLHLYFSNIVWCLCCADEKEQHWNFSAHSAAQNVDCWHVQSFSTQDFVFINLKVSWSFIHRAQVLKNLSTELVSFLWNRTFEHVFIPINPRLPDSWPKRFFFFILVSLKISWADVTNCSPLDLSILEVFFNLNDSMIISSCLKRIPKLERLYLQSLSFPVFYLILHIHYDY